MVFGILADCGRTAAGSWRKITVKTWPYNFKGFYGYRNFTIEDAEGKSVLMRIPSGFLWI